MPTVLRVVTRLNRGGPLRQLSALVPGLARRGYAGPLVFGAHVAGGEHDGREDLARAGAELRPLATLRRGIAPALDARALRDLLALARATRPDLIHTHMAKAGALGRLVAARLGVPAVHTFHGHAFDAPGLGGAAAALAERALGRLTTRAVALTPRQRRDVVEVHHVLPAEKVTVVAPGMDLDAFRRQAFQGPAVAPWPGDELPWFVWLGRLVPVKDPWLLLEAARRAQGRWRVALVGGGPLARRLARRLQRQALEARVLLAGHVEEPAPWLAGAAGLVMSSRREGSPLAVLEAFALGKPVIVPTVGGLPDLVEHGATGLWVAPGDPDALAQALDRLAGDERLRERLGLAASAAAARYGAEALASRTAALYDEILSRGAAR